MEWVLFEDMIEKDVFDRSDSCAGRGEA